VKASNRLEGKEEAMKFTGGGALLIMNEVRREAERRNVELIAVPTKEALELLSRDTARTNAILHLTC
jgi:hypothetical protein